MNKIKDSSFLPENKIVLLSDFLIVPSMGLSLLMSFLIMFKRRNSNSYLHWSKRMKFGLLSMAVFLLYPIFNFEWLALGSMLSLIVFYSHLVVDAIRLIPKNFDFFFEK